MKPDFYSTLPATLLVVLACMLVQGGVWAKEEAPRLDDSGDYLHAVFHLGLWVEDLDEMLAFLDEVMDVTIEMRVERRTGGERVILRDPRGQLIELLADPANVSPHPDFPLHPRGRVAGVAHIAIQVEDVSTLKNTMQAQGYEILAQVPEDYSTGYERFNRQSLRILYVRGPSAVTFEFFEIR